MKWLLLFLLSFQLHASVVIESRRIEIPGHPHAFNPSIVRWKEGYLLSFRIIPIAWLSFHAQIGLVLLDENFEIAGEPQILNTTPPGMLIPSRFDDGRLLFVNDTLWLVYSDNQESMISKGGFRVYIGEIEHDGLRFNLKNSECLSKFEGETLLRREKNWVPFDYEGNLLLAYSLIPHRIFRPLIGTNSCETIATSRGEINWEWGEIRGGTPGLLLDESQYLAFFHSSIDVESKLQYFIGAYTFSSQPPFEITQISPQPIIGKGYYDGNVYKPYWKPVSVVFPCGYIASKEHFFVVFGKHDHEVWITKLSREELLNSLVPVSTSR